MTIHMIAGIVASVGLVIAGFLNLLTAQRKAENGVVVYPTVVLATFELALAFFIAYTNR